MRRVRFKNRLVLSAMAGINDHSFCSKFPAGLVVLGGFSADEKSMSASKKAVKRGRKEFIFDRPLEGIKKEIEGLLASYTGNFAVNVRSYTIDGYIGVAKLVSMYNGILEINAHCRQPEFIEIGCGQSLLLEKDKLETIVEETSKFCLTAVKIRGNVEGLTRSGYVDLVKSLRDLGCKIVHVDAMIPGGGADLNLIERLAPIIFTVGNNSVVDVGSALEMINKGAKLVSSARAVLKDEKFFDKLLMNRKLAEEVHLEC